MLGPHVEGPERPAAGLHLAGRLRGEKLCGLPGTLPKPAVLNATEAAAVKNLTFKYKSGFTLGGGKVWFLAIKKGFNKCL